MLVTNKKRRKIYDIGRVINTAYETPKKMKSKNVELKKH